EFNEQLILITKPKRALEIGTAIAYTSIRIARNLKNNAVIHTIELSEDNINTAKRFIEKKATSKKNTEEPES
ncbi:O-methyltransferase, partial [candidate division KSB1 bacterium]|nr:O-methyltransferase [candidate division KSB1 bacterium]